MFEVLLILMLWCISVIFNDVEDTLAYHYEDSVFDWLPKNSWISWYMMSTDDTWQRKYVLGDTALGYKKIFGITCPAFFFDGWHGAKIVRQFTQYLTIYTAAQTEATFPILLGLILFGISNYTIHSVLFFEGMFLKKWWD